MEIVRRSVHFWNFNYYEWMAKNLGLTGALKWSLRFTALEHIIPGLLPSSASKLSMASIVGCSMPIHKWKALNAFKTRETMLAGAGQGELQAAEASLRVPLRIICIPLFNWLYAKGSEWKIPGLAHVVRGSWQLFSSEFGCSSLQGLGRHLAVNAIIRRYRSSSTTAINTLLAFVSTNSPSARMRAPAVLLASQTRA